MRLTTSAGANPVPDTVMLAPESAVAGETETEAANASEAVKLKTTKRKRHTRPEDMIAPLERRAAAPLRLAESSNSGCPEIVKSLVCVGKTETRKTLPPSAQRTLAEFAENELKRSSTLSQHFVLTPPAM